MNVWLGFLFGISTFLVEDWISSWHFEANITPVFGVVYGALTEWHRLTLQRRCRGLLLDGSLTEAGPDLSHRLVT